MINLILLVCAAVLPAAVLCIYVYKMDKVEKEPAALLGKLFILGIASCTPAAVLEDMLFRTIDGFFIDGNEYLYIAMINFVGVALVEEGVKLFFLYNTTKNEKEFDCIFDGIVYAVFVSLGFAALENVFYVLEYGWINAVLRAVLSVPGHMFFAVMMGYFYSYRQVVKKASEIEDKFIERGKIDIKDKQFYTTKYSVLMLLVPVCMHGTYNFCCSINKWWATVIMLLFVALMYKYCFGKIKEASANDVESKLPALKMVGAKHPNVKSEISTMLAWDELLK